MRAFYQPRGLVEDLPATRCKYSENTAAAQSSVEEVADHSRRIGSGNSEADGTRGQAAKEKVQ